MGILFSGISLILPFLLLYHQKEDQLEFIRHYIFYHLHRGFPVSAGGIAPFSAGIMVGFPTKGNL